VKAAPGIIERFLAYLEQDQKRSPNYLRNVACTMGMFQKCLGHNGLTTAAEIDIRRFKLYLERPKSDGGRGQRGSSVAQHIVRISRFFRWTRERAKVREDNPIPRDLVYDRAKEERYCPTPAEAARIVVAVADRSEREQILVHLLLGSGLRLEEATTVTRSDIATGEHPAVTLNPFKHKIKGQKERTVPASPELVALVETADEAGPLAPLARYQVDVLFAWITEHAELPKKLTPHCLRHAFATRAKQDWRWDIDEIRAIMGHESIETTRRYLHLDSRRIVAGVGTGGVA